MPSPIRITFLKRLDNTPVGIIGSRSCSFISTIYVYQENYEAGFELNPTHYAFNTFPYKVLMITLRPTYSFKSLYAHCETY